MCRYERFSDDAASSGFFGSLCYLDLLLVFQKNFFLSNFWEKLIKETLTKSFSVFSEVLVTLYLLHDFWELNSEHFSLDFEVSVGRSRELRTSLKPEKFEDS